MLKPPFTVIILKDSKHPLTLRITNRFVMLLLLAIFILIWLAVSGIIRYLPENNAEYAIPNNEQKSQNAEYILIEKEKNKDNDKDESLEPDVKDLAIQQFKNGAVEITFTFNKTGNNNELYVWLILNPEAEDSGETLIYPRSPLFRDVPVDYRNGILYNLMDNKYLKATFSGPEVGIDFKQLRVLAYSLEGNIIVNKSFIIQQNIRM